MSLAPENLGTSVAIVRPQRVRAPTTIAAAIARPRIGAAPVLPVHEQRA
jgi:hypothetical protein